MKARTVGENLFSRSVRALTSSLSEPEEDFFGEDSAISVMSSDICQYFLESDESQAFSGSPAKPVVSWICVNSPVVGMASPSRRQESFLINMAVRGDEAKQKLFESVDRQQRC